MVSPDLKENNVGETMKERDPYNAAEEVCDACDMQYLYCICDELDEDECLDCELPVQYCECEQV